MQEAERICELLVMIYQCSDNVATASFCQLGARLIPSIMMLASTRASSEEGGVDRLVGRFSAIRVSLPSVKDRERILKILLGLIRNPAADNAATKTYALSLLAGFTLHADSKSIVMSFPGLFEAVTDVAQSSPSIECRYQSARLLHNLAWDIRHRARMGQTKKCLDALVSLSDSADCHVRVEAFNALRHLSAETFNKAILVSTTDGKLLKSLMTVFNNDDYGQLRLQGLEILLNLVNRETAPIIGSHPGLIDCLGDTASSKGPDSIAALAAQSIKRLSAYVRVRDRCHDGLLQAMVQMSGCEQKAILIWTAKAFLEQSALPGNGFYIVRATDTLNSLANLAASCHPGVKCYALEALANLAAPAANAKKLASNNSILDALVTSIGDLSKSENALPRRHAVRAILFLASHRSSTKRMAKQLGLVSSLSRYGISQDHDVELRRAALHGVLILAPLL